MMYRLNDDRLSNRRIDRTQGRGLARRVSSTSHLCGGRYMYYSLLAASDRIRSLRVVFLFLYPSPELSLILFLLPRLLLSLASLSFPISYAPTRIIMSDMYRILYTIQLFRQLLDLLSGRLHLLHRRFAVLSGTGLRRRLPNTVTFRNGTRDRY